MLHILSLLILQDNLTGLADIENSLVLFVVATYGEGDPTDNARQLYDWLNDTDTDLSGVRYSVSACYAISSSV